MNRILERYCRALSILSGIFLAIMVVLVFGNVVLRYLLNSGITVSEEVSRWLFIWLTFMGGVVALQQHGHLGTDMLVSRLPPVGKKICLMIAQAAMLYVAWLLLQGSWTQAVINLNVSAPATGMSMAIFYASGVMFGASAMVILVVGLVRTVTGQLKDSELVMVQESEDLANLEAKQAHAQRALDDADAAPQMALAGHSSARNK